MKKIIIFILILSLILCLPSCETNNYDGEFSKLNSLADKSYTFYTIDINITSSNGTSIRELYQITSIEGTRTVRYKIERLNSFTVDGDSIYLPTDYTSVSEGTIIEVESESNKYALPDFDFSKNTLSVSEFNDYGTYSLMKANITSLNGFMNLEIDNLSNQALTVYYNSNQFNSLSVSYTSGNGTTTTITYTIQ